MTYVSFTPAVSRITQRIAGPSSIAKVAAKSWVICPAHEAVSPASLYPEGDLEKVVGVHADDTIEDQLRRARGGPQHHAATIAYELHGAVLADGHLYANRFVAPLGPSRQPWIATGDTTGPADAVLVTSSYGVKYFGHWLMDDLPRTLAAMDVGSPISALAHPTPNQQSYLALLDLDVPVYRNAQFERITLIEDFGQNASKRERYGALRRRATARHVARRNSGVMLLRGTTGNRRLLINEAEVAAAMTRRGFVILDPSSATPQEIIETCLDAHTIVGAEGSHLLNGVMWMSLQGTVVTLQPPQRFVTVMKHRCDCEDIRFGFVVGDRREGDDFHIDTDVLNRLLDRIDATATT